MSEVWETEAPAKLNLNLRVVRRREDGFHEIDSWMVRVDGLADRLRVERAEKDEFRCDAEGVPADGRNLVVRARDAYREAGGLAGPVRATLEKKIPHGAGLGGGSSDAAAMLRAMEALSEKPLGAEVLHRIAAGLGSDVPFFLYPGAARATGRGEILEPAASPGRMRVWLLKPAFGVETPAAYRRWKDSQELPGVPYGPQAFEWGVMVNDLERPVFEKHLFLAEVKVWLLAQEGVTAAMMSGSGSTMFAVLEESADLQALEKKAREELDPMLWMRECRVIGDP